MKHIRNFAIIAHIDHGKSTLADRMLEITGTVSKRDMVAQTLDSHPISRQRGITIKLAPVTMHYKFDVHRSSFIGNNNEQLTINYELNLIDTPGHVDFSYEVERSLAACEGAILLVDATQGIQAQTLSHFEKAKKLGLTIIPVINKIDQPTARVAEVENELIKLISELGEKRPINQLTNSPIHRISAKTAQGVPELLEAIVNHVPAPSGDPDAPTRALIFSSLFDPHRGVVAFIRVMDGNLHTKDKIRFLAAQTETEALEVGHFIPGMLPAEELTAGEVGYVVTNLKDVGHVQAGDTITTVYGSSFNVHRNTMNNEQQTTNITPLPGYRQPQPMVFVLFFPVDQNEFKELEDGLNKLHLNDAALAFSRTESKALGRGFRVGFLGHLHAEVSQERLEKDFGLSVLATTPTVEFKLVQLDKLDQYLEPWVAATIIVPQNYVGGVMTLCEDRRGVLKDMVYHGNHVNLHYELPLSEIITDFFDQLKSKTSGYGSLDYTLIDYRPFDAVSLQILINHQEIDALSQLVDKSKAVSLGTKLVEKLKVAIPKQQIPIPIQGSVNGQIIARADIPAYRKDVTAKLYGGDVTRRKKLLEKQKEGKKKMLALSRVEGKTIGQVTIPNDTFLKIFKT